MTPEDEFEAGGGNREDLGEDPKTMRDCNSECRVIEVEFLDGTDHYLLCLDHVKRYDEIE